jgi:hypothetical protein
MLGVGSLAYVLPVLIASLVAPGFLAILHLPCAEFTLPVSVGWLVYPTGHGVHRGVAATRLDVSAARFRIFGVGAGSNRPVFGVAGCPRCWLWRCWRWQRRPVIRGGRRNLGRWQGTVDGWRRLLVCLHGSGLWGVRRGRCRSSRLRRCVHGCLRGEVPITDGGRCGNW